MRRALWTTAAMTTVLGCASTPASSPPTQPTTALEVDVRRVADHARDDLGFAGLSIAVMRGDRLLLAEGYGWADRERGAPARADTIYEIGSITKQITAAAVMRLVEAGSVSLDAPIWAYLADYPQTSPPVLVRHLLAQSSGLPEYTDLAENREHMRQGRLTIPLAVAAVGKQPLLYEPGAWWSYSNSNFLLLGEIIERVTGDEYGAFFSKTFFEPLGMKDSHICSTDRTARHAVGYERREEGLVPMHFTEGSGVFSGSGGVCTTVVDLVAWTRALMSGRVVSASSLEQMLTPTPIAAGFTPPYGYGLSLLPVAGQRAAWHTGVSDGYTSALLYLPEHDTVMAMSANHHHAPLPVTALVSAVLDVSPRPVADLPTTAEQRGRLVGTYDDHLFRIRVFEADGRLHAHVSTMDLTVPLSYQGGSEFATAHPSGFRFWFEPATGGPASLLKFEWAEILSFGRRVEP